MTQPRIYWLQGDQTPLPGAQPRIYWLQITGTPVVAAPPAPSAVAGDAAGATLATITITDASGGTAAHRVQVRQVGGAWADAVGATNPMPPGVTTFAATGLPDGEQVEAQARAERAGLNSAYVASAPWWQDVAVGGGGELPGTGPDTTAPALTGTIAISALTSTGYTATCPVATDNVAVVRYQWRLGGAGAWTDIAAGGRAFTFTGRTPSSTDNLEMRALDAAVNASAPLSATINLPAAPVVAPSFTLQPISQAVVAGQVVTLAVAVTGTAPITLQWRRAGVPITGATGLTYSFAAQLADNGVAFDVVATNTVDSVPSSPAVLTVALTLPVTWLDWSAELTMFLPDCPISNIMLELRRQAIEFFRTTRAHRVGPAQVALTQAWIDEYPVATPAGWMLCGVPEAKVGTEEAEEIEFESRAPDEDGCGHDLLVGMASEGSLRVWPAPRVSGQPIRATLALTLADTATGLEASLYRRHRDRINAMALEMLMSQRDKPWSNPQEAARLGREAQAGRLLASTRAGPRSARHRLRTKPA